MANPEQACGDYRLAHPDYKPADMPAIPADLEDVSWHNNACPCFASDLLGIELWVDYLNPADREYGDTYPRFTVSQQRAGIEHSGPSLQTDDWNEILAFIALQRQRMESTQ